MIQYAEDEKETGNMNRLYDNYFENVDYDKTWGLIEYCIALVLNEKYFQNFKVHRKKLVQRLRGITEGSQYQRGWYRMDGDKKDQHLK